ncbi:MAG TPA: hypothetical protein PKC13_24645, partial [Blastocatellia bacterium]|nr:hypothetical protein [Blastocatellia bacterium]
ALKKIGAMSLLKVTAFGLLFAMVEESAKSAEVKKQIETASAKRDLFIIPPALVFTGCSFA